MRRYIFKLYPNAAQAATLHEHRKLMADLWNALKQRREDTYARHRAGGVTHREGKAILSFFDLTNEITTLRHECPEWRAVPAVTAHRVAKWLCDAYEAFFRRLRNGEAPGYPSWRSRERSTTIPLGTMSKTGWQLVQREDNPLSWRLHYGGATDVRSPGNWIHARGAFPAVVTDWRNADIIWRDGGWWLSIAVEIEPRRHHGIMPATIKFDLIDDFASTNGIAETPQGLVEAAALDAEVDKLKSARDTRWPRGTRRPRYGDDNWREYLDVCEAISRLSGRIARIRRDALHVWSARTVARSSDLTVTAPALRANTRSPRGDEKQWGANIEIVSQVNRNTLAQAPASAIAMLAYKAQEAGIRCDVITDEAPAIGVGGDLVAAGKVLRRARRQLREQAA